MSTMEPTSKTPAMNTALRTLFGDCGADAVGESRCVNPPVGCGKPVSTFRDEISAREYRISGLCQECQDRVFNAPDEADEADEVDEVRCVTCHGTGGIYTRYNSRPCARCKGTGWVEATR